MENFEVGEAEVEMSFFFLLLLLSLRVFYKKRKYDHLHSWIR